MNNDCSFRASAHARARQCQRSIPPSIVDLVLAWGRLWTQAHGRAAWFVGDHEVARAAREDVELRPARHVAVITSEDGTLVTVIRSGDVRRLRRPVGSYHRRTRR